MNSRCLIHSQDEEQLSLLKLTLREYGIHFRTIEELEGMGPLTGGCINLAWFIDLDGIQKSVAEIAATARRISPDSKIVFISSNFTLDLAQICLREQAIALLVKPFQAQRLIQCISSFKQEHEFVDREEFIPGLEEPDHDEGVLQKWAEDSLLRQVHFTCPVCANKFEGYRFKNWMFPVSNIELDFCPIYPKNVFPELYLIAVCSNCLYANHAGRFELYSPKGKEKEAFFEESKVSARRKLAGNLDFSGKREFQEGLKSLELAGMVCTELKFGDWETFFGELLLKTTWLCRRMGKKAREIEAQIVAVQHYMGL